MATIAVSQISDFYETLRYLLGDRDATIQLYPDAVLLGGVRSCIRLNQIPALSVGVDNVSLTPEITDPNQFALVAYHTVKGFVDSHPDRYSYKTRAMGESFGSWRTFLDELKSNIHRLESGEMFAGWYNYYTWLAGVSGLPLGLVLTELSVRAPFHRVGISVDGITP